MRDKRYGILVDVIKERTPREMKTKTAVLNGKPNAVNPHVRMDEGAVASYLPSAGRLKGGAKLRRGSPLYMKQVLFGVAFALAATGSAVSAQLPDEYQEVESPAAAAPVYTVTLPNGATNTLSEAFSLGLVSSSEGTASREGLVAAGDLRITGGGRLEINEDLKSEGFAGEIHVLPGATLRLTANGALGDTVHGTFVEDGATLETECLDSSANNKLDFAKEHLTFAGRGVGGVGALVARTPAKQERNGVWGGTYLTMTGDAMISAVAGYQDFPNNSSDNSLDMNGHVLTVRGFDTATGGVPSGFCLRPVVTNPGHIAITNCEVSINDLALLPGGEEHKLILLNRAALELYENKRFGRKGWTLYAPNPNTSIRMTLCGIWDGPLVADHDVALTLVSQKNGDGSVLTNSTYLAGKITVLGNFSVRNDSSPWATPTLTLSALEQEFQNQLFEIGPKILLKFSDEGDIGGAKSVMKFTDEAIVSGGSTGSWSGLVKDQNGDRPSLRMR